MNAPNLYDELLGALYLLAANEKRTIASKQAELNAPSTLAMVELWGGTQAADYRNQSRTLGRPACFARYTQSHPPSFSL